MNYLILTGRIITIMGLALYLTLITGRRKIAELPVFDFVVFITLGAIIGADIADPSIEHLPTAYAILLLVCLHYIYSIIIIKYRNIGKLLTFEPVVIVENGELIKGNLKRLKYSLDNVLMMLREQGVFDISEVEFAVIESTGKISVLKKSQYQPVVAKTIKVNTDYKGLSIPLVVEGKIYNENLKKLNLSKSWLLSKLKEKKIDSVEHVFFAAINTEGKVYISRGKEDAQNTHVLHH